MKLAFAISLFFFSLGHSFANPKIGVSGLKTTYTSNQTIDFTITNKLSKKILATIGVEEQMSDGSWVLIIPDMSGGTIYSGVQLIYNLKPKDKLKLKWDAQKADIPVIGERPLKLLGRFRLLINYGYSLDLEKYGKIDTLNSFDIIDEECDRCLFIGSEEHDQTFINLKLKNMSRLVPDLRKELGDTVYLEVKKIVGDSISKHDGIYMYRYWYQYQKNPMYINSKGTYTVYQYFLVENGEITAISNLNQQQRTNYLNKRYNKFSSKYGKKAIDDIFRDLLDGKEIIQD